MLFLEEQQCLSLCLKKMEIQFKAICCWCSGGMVNWVSSQAKQPQLPHKTTPLGTPELPGGAQNCTGGEVKFVNAVSEGGNVSKHAVPNFQTKPPLEQLYTRGR